MELSISVTLEIFSVSVIALLLLRREIAILWGKIISDCYPMPLLAGIIGGCLLLIAFVISFHSNVFTENDRYNTVRNSERAKGNGYNWIDLVDIYRYPLDQIVLERYFQKANLFDFSPKLESKQNYHLIIVDKTKSTVENEDTKKLLITAKRLLKDEVEKISIESGRRLDMLESFSDIVAVSCAVDAIVQGKSQVKIGFYRGKDMANSRCMDYISFDATSEKLDSFIEKYYFESVKEYNHKYSDFAQLFESIANKGLIKEQRKDMDVILTLVSDFEDDLPYYTEKNLINQLNSISNSNLKQMNSFILTRTNSTGRTSRVNNNILSAIQRVFVQNSWMEVCNEKELCEDTQNHLVNIITNPNRPLGNEQEISALSSFDYPYSLRSGKATLYLLNNGMPCKGEITICLKSAFPNTEQLINKISMGDKNIPLVLNEYKTSSFIDGRIDLTFPKQLAKSDEYYLHIYSIDHKKKITTPIVFREQLTNTSSVMLIFLYSLLYGASAVFLGVLGWSFVCYVWIREVLWKTVISAIVAFAFSLPVTCILIMALYHLFALDKYSNDVNTEILWIGILPCSFIFLLVGLNVKNIHQKIMSLAEELI